MLFPTVAFAVFFVVAFVASWLLRPTYRVWLLVMTGFSLFFYGWADARFVALLVTSIVVNWAFGRAIFQSLAFPEGTAGPAAAETVPDGVPFGEATSRSQLLVRAAVVVNLGFLGFFKYYGFFVDSIAGATDAIGLDLAPPVLQIALPVGISFFTFHAISYVIDVGRTELRPMRLDEMALYMSFFPHLVAGPIVRASEFKPQMRIRSDPRRVEAGEAFRLIAFGLFKKVVISTYLAAELVDPVFGAPGAHSSWELLVGTYAYAIQIYADFSGYTDIAIGCALLLGIRFPQNFDAPYRALSLQEFWRRWHMTLSRWLRDYLYIPLGGNRGGVRKTYRNLFLTMVIGGLWHGAAWTFVVWGALHGGYLAAERYVGGWWRNRANGAPPVLPVEVTMALKWALTFHVVCLAWIFFRADSLGTAFDVIAGILSGRGPTTLVTPLLLAVVGLSLLSQFVPSSIHGRVEGRFTQIGLAWQGLAVAGALTVIDLLGPEGVAPFIYFQF